MNKTGIGGFKKGVPSWNKGKSFNAEQRRNMSLAHMGHKLSQETKDKIGKASAGRFCSEERRKKISEANRGINCYNWKGGITPVNVQVRNSSKYRQYRTNAFVRDDFTCKICGQKGGKLNADHYPVAFSVMLNELKSLYGIEAVYEMAMNYPKLWDLNNMRTLCVDCHTKTLTYKNKKIDYVAS